jgi:hypothetical protein
MTITTEEADRLAQTHDLVRFTLGMKQPEHDLTAATIRSLAAEADKLQAENARLRRLVQILIEEDPNDMAADAVTVLDVWRKEALAALGEKDNGKV